MPSEVAVNAGNVFGSATNDTVESGFGQLDRQQTMRPNRNPLNTSAVVTAKRDKPVEFVLQQEPALQKVMVRTARKSGHRARKEAGTKSQQLQNVWERGLSERKERADRRRENRRKKQEKLDAMKAPILSGGIVRNPEQIKNMRSKELTRTAPHVGSPLCPGGQNCRRRCHKGHLNSASGCKKGTLNRIVPAE